MWMVVKALQRLVPQMINANLWECTADSPAVAPQCIGDVKADVVVIGGGFTGCATALHLAQAGTAVCLLEANSVGHGGSGRSVGLVNAGLWLEPEKVEAVLGKIEGRRLDGALAVGPAQVFSLIYKYGIACQTTQSGTLHCAHSTLGWASLKERARQYLERGASVDLLNAEEAAVKTGTDHFAGALLDHRAGTIQPLAYVRGLAKAAIAQGATVYEKSSVQSIEFHNQSWWVSTPRGCVRASALVLATNAYHQDLAIAAQPQYIPVYYFQLATQPLRAEHRDTILPERQGAWDTAKMMTSFRMDAEGRLILGAVGSLEKKGQSIHGRWLRRKMNLMFPAASEYAFDYAWTGRIAMTGDHIPRIIKFGEQALSIYGYSGRGIAPGTVFGTAAAKYLLSGDESQLPIKPVRSHRENLSIGKQVSYEIGAGVFHFLSSRQAK